MTDSLTTLISKIQALFIDTGTNFTTATVTAGIRSALQTFNEHAPINASDLIATVTNQYEYELTTSNTIRITDILLKDANGENDIYLDYDAYSEDERSFFRLRTQQKSSQTLICRYTIPHTINGLDSETDSTIPKIHDQTIVYGGAYYCCIIRGASSIETINIKDKTPNNYFELAKIFKTNFNNGLLIASLKKPAVSQKDTRAWNDVYHNWQQ